MVDLFTPLTLRGVTLRNRIGVSPMCMYSCENQDGFANDWHLAHLGTRASGGAALVMTEAAAVEARGRISPQDLGIWDDAHVDKLAQVVRFVQAQGAVAAMQLAHAGRKAGTHRPWDDGRGPLADGGWPVVGPTDEPFSEGFRIPQAMTLADIRTVQQAFVQAARRADAAGFDLVEIHGAHGYLIHQFLSPLVNKRQDAYGGSFENRTRFLLEVTEQIRAIWPEHKPLAVRLSATDWHEDGWQTEDSVLLAQQLHAAGVDLVDCSSGGAIPGLRYATGPGYQVALAAAVRRGAAVATAAVGMITEPAQADTIIRSGQADVVLLGRAMLRDPYWAQRAAVALGRTDANSLPPQYQRAY